MHGEFKELDFRYIWLCVSRGEQGLERVTPEKPNMLTEKLLCSHIDPGSQTQHCRKTIKEIIVNIYIMLTIY